MIDKQKSPHPPNAKLVEHLENVGAKRSSAETALMVQQCLKKILSKESFNAPALTIWLDGLLSFDGAGPTVKISFSAQDYGSIKVILSQLMTRIFKDRGSKPTESLKKDFLAIENWIYQYHTVCTNIGERMSTVINVPEENVYAKIKGASFELSLHQILKAFESGDIAKVNWKTLNPKEALGGFLFHVICLSGITNLNILYRIAILSIHRSEMDDPYSGFLLSRDGSSPLATNDQNPKTIKNRNEDLIYRWIPDPTSKKVYELHHSKWQTLPIQLNSLEPLVMQFVAHLQKCSPNIGALNQIGSLKHLFDISKHYQRTTLPSYIWHYLEGSFNTKDLPPQSIERLHDVTYQWEESISSLSARGLEFVGNSEELHLLTWATKIVAAITSSPDNRRKLRLEWLTKKYSSREPLIETLKEWLIWKIDQQTLSPEIAKEAELFLPAILKDYELSEDFGNSDAEERIDELEELLCNLPHSKVTHFKKAWHNFHQFLLETERIGPAQYEDTKQSRKSMNAEYISAYEYEFIRALLSKAADDPNKESDLSLKNKLSLVFTLAYRMGLRRSEVLKLATAHITMRNGQLDLLCVRWWKERRLKTKSSQRSIPIQGLLTNREYLELKLYILYRRKNRWPQFTIYDLPDADLEAEIAKNEGASPQINSRQGNNNPFLFLDDQGDIEKECELIISRIRSAMSVAIPNRKPKFHQLRHASATNFLLLMSANKLKHSHSLITDLFFGNAGQLKKGAPLTLPGYKAPFSDSGAEYFTERARNTREALLSDYQHPYAEIYATSRVLGHSSPKTTLGSYIHAIPLLAGAYLYDRCIDYSEKLQRALFPGDRRTFTRYTSMADITKAVLEKTKVGRPINQPK